jgi:DNA primase
MSDRDAATRFLYLRGGSRSGLPPYGLCQVLKLPPSERRELVLVEGLLDVHHLRAKGMPNIAAVGGARIQPDTVTRLAKHGVDTVVLAFDNDQPGRDGLVRAIDRISRAPEAPTLRVLDPAELGDSKDPDEFVREQGIDEFRRLFDAADCAITWRALDHVSHVTPSSDPHERRTALARAGKWLGTLPRDSPSNKKTRSGPSHSAVATAPKRSSAPTAPASGRTLSDPGAPSNRR